MNYKLSTIAITLIIGGVTTISVRNENVALWTGIILIAIGSIILFVAYKLKRGRGMQEEDNRSVIKNTKIDSKIKHAKEALGADFEGDYELENVDVKLEAEDVEKATGAKFKSSGAGAAVTGITMSCSNCGKMFPKTFTGVLPEQTECPYCGYMNEVRSK